jgi:hypothetical protein
MIQTFLLAIGFMVPYVERSPMIGCQLGRRLPISVNDEI